MIRGVLGSRASIGGVLGSGRGGAAAAWYLAGGVSAANCIAAYTPKGAASLAASYDNNAAPGNGLADGTYDAAPGVAPTWAAATGWTFNGSSQYLTTGITPTAATTLLIRFAATVTGSIAGMYYDSNTQFRLILDFTANVRLYGYGQNVTKAPAPTSGVIGISNGAAYYNGIDEGLSLGTYDGTNAYDIFLGARKQVPGTPQGLFTGSIQAVYIGGALTAPQVAAISTAMAAL